MPRRREADAIEVLRTAFADCFFWQNGRYHSFFAQNGEVRQLCSNTEVLFDMVLRPNYRVHVMLEDFFEKAVKRFGPLTEEECFGFAPHPALGGRIDKDHVIKTRERCERPRNEQIHKAG